jgi:hypothetical protein
MKKVLGIIVGLLKDRKEPGRKKARIKGINLKK